MRGEARLLERDKPWERELNAGEQHLYRVQVGPGQFVRVIVDQLSINVVATLYGPDGSKLIEKNRSMIASETILILGDPAGEYRLEIRPVYQLRAPGRYRVRIAELRKATARDPDRVTAQKLDNDANHQVRYLNAESNRLALLKFGEAMRLWRDAGDRQEEAFTLHNIGNAEFSSGQNEPARDHYQQLLSIWKSLGEREYEALTLLMLGRVQELLGDRVKGFEYLNSAVEIQRSIGNKEGEILVLRILGMHQERAEEHEQALETFGLCLSLSQSMGNSWREALALGDLGLTYWRVGDYHKALDFHLQALSIWRRLGDTSAEQGALEYIGLVYDALGEHQRALEYYSSRLTYTRANGYRPAEADVLTGIGAVYAALNEHQKALETLNQALVIYREVGNQWGVPYALRNIASVYISLKDPSKALAYFNQALPLDRVLKDQTAEAKGLAGMALAYRDLGEFDKARAHIENALDIIESLRTRFTSHELRAAFFASKWSYYQFYVDLLMRLDKQKPGTGFDAAALQASERARARSLLDLLAEAKVDLSAGLDPRLQQKDKDLQADISSLNSRLLQALAAAAPDKELLARLKDELQQTENSREQLAAEIRKRHPKYAELKYPAPLQLAAIQELLDEHTTLLEYSLGKDSSYLFVVTRQGLTSYRLPPAAEINRLVHDVRAALEQPGRRQFGRFAGAAWKLHQILIAPANDALKGKQRLLIAPDSGLYYLPFEALLTGPPEVHGKPAYLLERWAVSYLPSASVLTNLRQRQSEAQANIGQTVRKEFLAFADPDYSIQTPQSGAPQTKLARVLRSIFDVGDRLDLQKLKDSSREATGIAKFYRPDRTAMYLGAAASEETVKSNKHLSTARRIHFATHGLISERLPQLSGLVLTLDEDAREDGLLQVYEIFNLKLSADLVVLSACRTGLGKEVRGEGVIGLTRAFLYAGASTVTVSLWQVADRSTSDLMIHFYEQMNAGRGKTEALRRAKLRMIEDNRHSHPFYWAPFILIGEPDG